MEYQEDFGFPKAKPVRDTELLEIVRKLPCMGCGQSPSDAHHVTPRGAGGSDVPDNLMPLCRVHHAEWHQDPSKMIRKYPVVRNWLESAERWDVLSRYLGKKDPRTQ